MSINIHQNHTNVWCFVASIYSAGCVQSSGGEWQWGSCSGRGACWRWRVDSICIWHTDCTKYANRQTMTFAVVFSLWYCSLSKQKEHDVAAYTFAWASARLMHLPGASISLSWIRGPRPCSTNHMKGLPSVRIALSKATLMYEKGAGCLWKKGLQV